MQIFIDASKSIIRKLRSVYDDDEILVNFTGKKYAHARACVYVAFCNGHQIKDYLLFVIYPGAIRAITRVTNVQECKFRATFVSSLSIASNRNIYVCPHVIVCRE